MHTFTSLGSVRQSRAPEFFTTDDTEHTDGDSDSLSVSSVSSVVHFFGRVFVRGLTSIHTTRPNQALQRTAAGRRGCNRRASWPPSLSLGRSPRISHAYCI